MADINTTPNINFLSPTALQEYQDRMNKLLNPAPQPFVAPKVPLIYSPSYNPAPVADAPIVKDTPPTDKTTVPPAINPTSTEHIVSAGDTLSAIAQKNGTTVDALIKANPSITNPDLISVGQKINLGTPAPVVTPADKTTTPPAVVTAPTNNAPATKTVTTTNSNIAPDSAKGFAESAGRAGLSYDEYVKLNQPTKAETDAIAKELGITALEGEVFKKPTQSSQATYQALYDTAGLADTKKKITDLNTKINAERELARTAIGAIDENPWLTETSRVGRGKRVLDQSEQKINNLLTEQKQLQDLYDKGIGEINGIITRNQNDFGLNQSIDQAKLNYLVKKAETQSTQLSTDKATTGLAGYLKGKVAGEKPTTIGTAETGFYRWDATLGKFVQVTTPVGKSTTFSPTAEQKGLVGRFINSDAGKKLGATADDLNKALTDQNFFYYLLQQANDNGIY